MVNSYTQLFYLIPMFINDEAATVLRDAGAAFGEIGGQLIPTKWLSVFAGVVEVFGSDISVSIS